jgi:hypothetical protein
MSADQSGQSNAVKVLLSLLLLVMFCGGSTFVYVYNVGSGLGEHFATPAPRDMTTAAHT